MKNKCLSLSEVSLVWKFFGMASAAFAFMYLFLGHFSSFEQFVRILNNCKMDQQKIWLHCILSSSII